MYEFLHIFQILFHAAPGQAFYVLAFATAQQDLGHISFVQEAEQWFPQAAAQYNFTFDTTRDWNLLNSIYLQTVDLVIFLDTRPENPEQRLAFERYIEGGGAWLGFHFSAFALTPSAYPQDWDWYHNNFLGSGEYWSNTWKPTPAYLKVENILHPVTRNLPTVFSSQANEWYRWQRSLVDDPNIEILLSIEPASFPLGTGPNPGEIWWEGYYPVVWRNKNYKMIYMNMGHNDIDYEHGNAQASWTFGGETQNKLIINSMLWLTGNLE